MQDTEEGKSTVEVLQSTNKKPDATEIKREAKKAYRNLLKDPMIRDKINRAVMPITLHNLSYHADIAIRRMFEPVEIHSAAIENITSNNDKLLKVEEILINLIDDFNEDIDKKIKQSEKIADDSGLLEPVKFSRGDDTEIIVYAGSPIAVQFANAIVKFNTLVEIVHRLRIGGRFSKSQKDDAIREFNRKLRKLRSAIIINSNKTFFSVLSDRRAEERAVLEKQKIQTEKEEKVAVETITEQPEVL